MFKADHLQYSSASQPGFCGKLHWIR